MPKATLRTGKPILRRYATHYYSSTSDAVPALSSWGACASEKGAIRASVVRVFTGEYVKAVIFDRELEVPIYSVALGEDGLQVHYGDSTNHTGKS